MLISMNKFNINESGIVKNIEIKNTEILHRIRDIGIISNIKFTMIGKAFFGNDPLMIKINKCIIIIRQNEAEKIKCKLINDKQ